MGFISADNSACNAYRQEFSLKARKFLNFLNYIHRYRAYLLTASSLHRKSLYNAKLQIRLLADTMNSTNIVTRSALLSSKCTKNRLATGPKISVIYITLYDVFKRKYHDINENIMISSKWYGIFNWRIWYRDIFEKEWYFRKYHGIFEW